MNGRRRAWICLGLLAGLNGVALLAGDAPSPGPAGPSSDVKESLRELWRANIKALADEHPSSAIDQSVRTLNSIRLKPKFLPPAQVVTSQPSSTPARLPQTAPAPPVQKGIAPEVLEKLKKLPASGLASPEELADALFLSGHLDAAGTFYAQALEAAEEPEEKAWLMYQMANCRRAKDPAGASGLYKQILADYPDSLWASLADVQDRLIEWHRKSKPRDTLQAVVEKLAPPTTRPSGSLRPAGSTPPATATQPAPARAEAPPAGSVE
jgi:tetratricopeptide (TPR) repeat protein